MGLDIFATYSSGSTLFATAQQVVSGVLGDTWNVTTGAWASSVADADSKITLTEGTGRNAGSYFGAVTTTLGTYTGPVAVRVHNDNLSDITLSGGTVDFSVGNELTLSVVSPAAVSASELADRRLWKIRLGGEYPHAQEIVHTAAGATVTVGMDFAGCLNPNTDLNAVSGVVVDTVTSGTAPTLSSNALNQTRKQAHTTASGVVQGEYRLKFTVTTTDSQTFVGYGWLHAE